MDPMDRPRLALLDASYAPSMTRRNFRRELDATLAEFPVNEGTLPTDTAFDGFVVTGSAASVYWDDPWIDATEQWAREALEAGLPGLGVCFGHQLLASALGGTVEAMEEYELGYREIHRVDDVALFKGLGDGFLAFESHSDAVTALPPGAEPIAENDRGLQGFRTSNAFTVQFHPEYDMDSAEAVARSKDLPDERIESVVAGITPETYARACETKRLFDNFIQYVQQRRARPAD